MEEAFEYNSSAVASGPEYPLAKEFLYYNYLNLFVVVY